MKSILHRTAGSVAIVLIAAFWVSTVGSELSGEKIWITQVKVLIPWGFVILLPALAATAGSGIALARGRSGGLLSKKQKRMPVIALNGLAILVPSAFFLAAKAREGEFDVIFYVVQALELFAGAVNIWLLGLNMRDGFKMTAGRRRVTL